MKNITLNITAATAPAVAALLAWTICRYHHQYINNYSLFISFLSLGLSVFVLWIAYTIEKHVHQSANKKAIIDLHDKYVSTDMGNESMSQSDKDLITTIIENVIEKKTLPNCVNTELQSCLDYVKKDKPKYEVFAFLIDKAYNILTSL